MLVGGALRVVHVLRFGEASRETVVTPRQAAHNRSSVRVEMEIRCTLQRAEQQEERRQVELIERAKVNPKGEVHT